MTYTQLNQIRMLERKIAKWNGQIESLLEKRDRAQGRLDDLREKDTMDARKLERQRDEYLRRIKVIEDALEEQT